MGKGYYLENQCKWYYRNQGIFAIRLHTRLQVGELRKVDVIVSSPTGVIFIQCKSGKHPYFKMSDKVELLELAERYHGQALLCTNRNRKIEFQYLSSNTKFRPKTKLTQFLKGETVTSR